MACGYQEKSCLLFKYQAGISDLKDQDVYLSNHSTETVVWKCFAIPFSQSNLYYDSEQCLRIKFKTIQANYLHAEPNPWPSEKQLLKLADIASHEPVFADTAIQFIEDPNFGDPITRLNQILAFIDEVNSFNDQPYIYTNALYTHILSSAPSILWPTIQQVLGTLYYGTTHENSSLRSPRGISAVCGLELRVVYTALSSCYPMVLIPPEDIPLGSMAFHHASFSEYLIDPTQSQSFHISIEDIETYILKKLINIWQDFKKQSQEVPSRFT